MPSQAGLKQTFQRNVADALAGNADAALVLARMEPDEGFIPFITRVVKPEQMTKELFELLAVAHERMKLEELEKSASD